MFEREAHAALTLAATAMTSLIAVPSLLTLAGLDFFSAYAGAALMTVLGTAFFAARGTALLVMPSLPIAAWLTFIVIISHGLSFEDVLLAALLASLLGAALFASRMGRALLLSIPQCLRAALSLGLGLMLIVQGLFMGRILVSSPWAVLSLGDFSDPLAYMALSGLVLTLILWASGVRSALGLGFLVTLLLSFAEGFVALPDAPGFFPETLGLGAFLLASPEGHVLELCGTVLALLLVTAAESFSVLEALGEGPSERRLKEIFSFSALGACLGALPLVFTPLSAALLTGARTRRMLVLTALFMLMLFFLAPVLKELASFPAMVVPVIVLSGAYLVRHAGEQVGASLGKQEEFFPALSAALLLPLSQNVTAALGAGFIEYVLFKLLGGHAGEVTPVMRVLSIFFVLYFLLGFL